MRSLLKKKILTWQTSNTYCSQTGRKDKSGAKTKGTKIKRREHAYLAATKEMTE